MSASISSEDLARRLDEVERKLDAVIAALGVRRAGVNVQQPQPGWLNEIRGMFANEPAFGEVIEYGRQFRNADRPSDDEDLGK